MPANRRPQAPGSPGRGSSRPGGQSSAASRRGPGTAGGASGTEPARTASRGASAATSDRGAGTSTPSAAASRGRGKAATAATSPRKPRGRPSSPSSTDRTRGRWGALLPEVVTVRTLVLSVVVLLAVVLLLPTVRAYVNQTGDLRDLRSQLAGAQDQRRELEVELARWDDTNYVVQQARNRLNYVMPGDTPWRVLDPETVVDDTNPATGESLTDGPIRDFAKGTPWYESVWESVQLAGEHGAGPTSGPDSPSPSPSPAGPTGGASTGPTADGSGSTGDNG